MLFVHVFWKTTCLPRCRSKPNRNVSGYILLCVLVSESISPVLLLREKHASKEIDMTLGCTYVLLQFPVVHAQFPPLGTYCVGR